MVQGEGSCSSNMSLSIFCSSPLPTPFLLSLLRSLFFPIFIYFRPYWAFAPAWLFCRGGAWGLLSSCSMRLPHCGGVSCCKAWALGHVGFSSCSSWVLEHRISSRGTRASLLWGTWDLLGAGIEPKSPALAGRFFTTEPAAGKPLEPLASVWCERERGWGLGNLVGTNRMFFFLLVFWTFYFVLGYNWLTIVMIVSDGQRRDSSIHIHVSLLPKTPLPSSLPHNIEQCSMCYTIGTCWQITCSYKFSVLYQHLHFWNAKAKDLTLCYLLVVLLAIPRKQWMLGFVQPMTKKRFYIF